MKNILLSAAIFLTCGSAVAPRPSSHTALALALHAGSTGVQTLTYAAAVAKRQPHATALVVLAGNVQLLSL